MPSAYTPGLTVNERARIRLVRRLPVKGEVLVEVGQTVAPETAVARTELPGDVTLLRAADRLGVTGDELLGLLRKQVGEAVEAGELLAETPGLFGRFFKTRLECPITGTIETVTARTGNMAIRRLPKPVELLAHVGGEVVEVWPGEGATIEARGALVQGIFGIGGERRGRLVNLPAADAPLPEDLAGAVVVVPGLATAEFYRQAASRGAVGLVSASVLDPDLTAVLGYEIGVAITGEEDLPATWIITEGFGEVAMADRTRQLLLRLEGRAASISGATQIRAGVIRPEIIVPDPELAAVDLTPAEALAQELVVGATIRFIRAPYFGLLGTVTGLPPEPEAIATGASVRVLRAVLATGDEVVVPRANVEIIAG